MTPGDPRWFFVPITFEEGVTLYHMYKSRVNATQFKAFEAFLVKMTFWPLWPQMTPGDFLYP